MRWKIGMFICKKTLEQLAVKLFEKRNNVYRLDRKKVRYDLIIQYSIVKEISYDARYTAKNRFMS